MEWWKNRATRFSYWLILTPIKLVNICWVTFLWVVNGCPEAHWTPSDNFACPRCECDKCVAASNGGTWPTAATWVECQMNDFRCGFLGTLTWTIPIFQGLKIWDPGSSLDFLLFILWADCSDCSDMWSNVSNRCSIQVYIQSFKGFHSHDDNNQEIRAKGFTTKMGKHWGIRVPHSWDVFVAQFVLWFQHLTIFSSPRIECAACRKHLVSYWICCSTCRSQWSPSAVLLVSTCGRRMRCRLCFSNGRCGFQSKIMWTWARWREVVWLLETSRLGAVPFIPNIIQSHKKYGAIINWHKWCKLKTLQNGRFMALGVPHDVCWCSWRQAAADSVARPDTRLSLCHAHLRCRF